MTEDSNNDDSHSFLLDDNSRFMHSILTSGNNVVGSLATIGKYRAFHLRSAFLKLGKYRILFGNC